MKWLSFFFLSAAMLWLAGCSSYRSDYNTQGGTYDSYGTATGAGQSNPEPAASPTFRPGMNPDDPRDPQFTTRPQPFPQPPNP